MKEETCWAWLVNVTSDKLFEPSSLPTLPRSMMEAVWHFWVWRRNLRTTTLSGSLRRRIPREKGHFIHLRFIPFGPVGRLSTKLTIESTGRRSPSQERPNGPGLGCCSAVPQETTSICFQPSLPLPAGPGQGKRLPWALGTGASPGFFRQWG